MMDSRETGERIRRLRLIAGLGQVEFANRISIATGSVSKLENGRMPVSESLLESIARVLDCSPAFLWSTSPAAPTSRPWLRAYADASKRSVDRQVAECTLATEIIRSLKLKKIPDTVPSFDGDLSDEDNIEQFALDVRAAAQLGEDEVVGNAIRAAERLGCLVLPMREELGRHVGLSAQADLTPVICVSRPSLDPQRHVPGDRQRFTVAHELGHLALHGGVGPPQTAEEARRVETQAHFFAAAFLAPGEAMLEELEDRGGRVTLRTLAGIKQRWGVAIKALVLRFKSLGVIDAEQARSLYKQISARGWNKEEPVHVGNEHAVWLTKAIEKRFDNEANAFNLAAEAAGIGRAYFERWTDWNPTGIDRESADIVELDAPSQRVHRTTSSGGGTVTRMPVRRH